MDSNELSLLLDELNATADMTQLSTVADILIMLMGVEDWGWGQKGGSFSLQL